MYKVRKLEPTQQLLLPLVGIPKASVSAVAAYFACVATCLPTLPSLGNDGMVERHFRNTHATLIAEFPDKTLSPRIPDDYTNMIKKYTNMDPKVSETSKLQRFIMQKVKSVFMSKLESGEFPQELVTVAQCSRAKHANILFHVPPMHPSFSLSTEDWNQMMRARLALPAHDHLPEICPHTVCSLALDDTNRAHHQHSCIALKPDTTSQPHSQFLSLLRTHMWICVS